MRPAEPAAAFVCPICDFTDPSAHHALPSGFAGSKTDVSPRTSAASPAFVAVPCASTSSTVAGLYPAFS